MKPILNYKDSYIMNVINSYRFQKKLDFFYFDSTHKTGMLKEGSLITEMYSRDGLRIYQNISNNKPADEDFVRFTNVGSSTTSDFFYIEGFNSVLNNWDKFYFETSDFFIGGWANSYNVVSGNDVQGIMHQEQGGSIVTFLDIVESNSKIRGGITNSSGSLIYITSATSIIRGVDFHYGFGRKNGRYYLTIGGVITALLDRGSNDVHKLISSSLYAPMIAKMSGINRMINGYVYDMLILKNSPYDPSGKVVGDTLFSPWVKCNYI